jgi:Uma2 family endonuclease
MAVSAHKSATYADLEAVPPHLVAEILFGSLVTHPRPSRRHGAATSALGILTGGAFQFGSGGPGGWIFIDEPELHLGPHVVVPDLAGWRRDRLMTADDRRFIATPPDWVCEALADSTERYDRIDKRRIYATYAVPHLWLLDPRVKVLEVFLRQDQDWLLTHTFIDNDPVSAPPFDAITFDLGLLWPFDTPVPPTA